MSSESSDSPERNQSRKVSFKSHSDKVRTLSAVTRKLSPEEEVRGRTSPFKANVEKVKMLSDISRSFSKERGSSGKEKSTMNFQTSAKKVGILSKTTRMISTESSPSKERVSGAESEEKPSGARPKTSKWRQKEFPPSSSPSPRQEATNMSRISSLFGSEVEIPQERAKSSRRSRSEEKKGRPETGSKKPMGSYTDIYQVFSHRVSET